MIHPIIVNATPRRIAESLVLGFILAALLLDSCFRELAAAIDRHRPYRRDKKRAATIGLHSLLHEPERLWEGD